MVQFGMTQNDVAAATGLDHRTLRNILRGNTRPHARTLHKLAEGLGISTDELYQTAADDDALAAAKFDRATNPAVAEVIRAHPELFSDWTTDQFNELFSRMAVGGELTKEGALQAAEEMNAKRELMHQVAVVMESGEADLLSEFVQMLFRRITDVE